MSELEQTPAADRVWILYKERWFPGVLETWNTREGRMRFWIRYAVPINGWAGGWHDHFEPDSGDDLNGEGLTWSARVAAAHDNHPGAADAV